MYINDDILKQRLLTLIPIGIAMNLTLGSIVHALHLPIYLDAVGTILITLIAGLNIGIAVGVLSFLIGGLFIDPVLPWFVGTQAIIAIYIHMCARKKCFQSKLSIISSGIGLGIVAGIASAPVIVLIFGGVTGSGRDLITGLIASTGEQIFSAVAMSGFASEPIDKTLQLLLALWIIKGIPKDLLSKFTNNIFQDEILTK